jgi:chromosome segregation ATPase
MRLLAVPLIAALAILAQATSRKPVRPKGAAGSASSSAREADREARDAGADQRDAGPPSPVEQLRREISALQARTDALEQELRRDRERRDRLSEQLQALQRQFAERDQREQAQAVERQAQLEQTQRGVSTLLGVQNSLAVGNFDVESAIGAAQDSLPPQSQGALEAAREALRNHDLYNARLYVSQAIAAAQAGAQAAQ